MTDTNVVRHRPDVPDGDPPLVDEQLADELLARAQAQGVELLGPDGLLSQVTKSVLERALGEELTEHLGYDKHDPVGRGSGNSRNGSTPKRLLTEVGPIDLAVPRDRAGSFEPQIVRKGQTRLDGFNDRIVALYARGMTTRDIRGHLREMYARWVRSTSQRTWSAESPMPSWTSCRSGRLGRLTRSIRWCSSTR